MTRDQAMSEAIAALLTLQRVCGEMYDAKTAGIALDARKLLESRRSLLLAKQEARDKWQQS